MSSKTLRALARDYANGMLDTPAYRKARDQLFEGVISGKIPVQVNEYRPLLNADQLSSTTENMAALAAASEVTAINIPRPPKPPPSPAPAQVVRTPPSPAPVTAKPGADAGLDPGQYWIFAGIAIIVVCVALLLVVYFRFLESGPTQPPEELVVEETADPRYTAGQLLMENFLQRNDWSEANLQTFMAQWQALNLNEQMDGLASPQKTQLANAIHTQLLEERALLALGDADAVRARQQLLVNFANGLGINDPRLTIE